MIKKFLLVAGIALAVFVPTAAGATHQPTHFVGKVTICHATGSESNPYVRINVSVNALKNSGHGTVNVVVALETIGELNPGQDLTAFVEIGGHDGDIFLLDPENDVPCPETPDVPLVTAELCLEGEEVTVGPSFQADVDAVVADLVAAGATLGDCPVVVTTTTTSPPPPVVEPPVVEPVTPAPPAPVTLAAPAPVTAPAPTPSLPVTGAATVLLAFAGALAVASGLAMRFLFRTNN